MIFSRGTTAFNQQSKWVLAAAVLFFGSLLLCKLTAYLYGQQMLAWFSGFFAHLGELLDEVYVETTPLIGGLRLFANNLRAVLMMMLTGPVLLFTILGLVINGGAIGVMGALMASEGVMSLATFYLLGILPHGIFELAAVLLGGAIGLRLGIQLIFPPRGKGRWATLVDNYKLAWRSLPVIVVLLAIAAVIEVFITPHLLELAL